MCTSSLTLARFSRFMDGVTVVQRSYLRSHTKLEGTLDSFSGSPVPLKTRNVLSDDNILQGSVQDRMCSTMNSHICTRPWNHYSET